MIFLFEFIHYSLFVLDDGKIKNLFQRYFNDDSFLATSENTDEPVNESIPR
jgi:hypothetical protein